MEKFPIENIEKSGKEKVKKPEEAPEIKMAEIAELSEPVKRILSGLRKNIEKGEYVAILGDDASGKLPARLFYRVLSDIYKEKDFDRLKILSFAGQVAFSPELKEKISQDFTDFIEKTKVRKMAENKKVLFVTDTIASGEHLRPFTETLKKMEINFDIATIGISCEVLRPETMVEMLEKKLGGKIFWGQGSAPAIYSRHDLGGVQDRLGYSIFAELYPSKKRVAPLGEPIRSIRRFEARDDVEILAQKLIKWYKEGGKKSFKN